MLDHYDLYWLSRVDANIENAQRSIRDAMQGYVAVHADPDRNPDPDCASLFARLSEANSALVDAAGEAQTIAAEVAKALDS